MNATMEIPIAKMEIIARSTVFTAIMKSPYRYIPRLLFEIKFQGYLGKRKEVCFKSLPRLPVFANRRALSMNFAIMRLG